MEVSRVEWFFNGFFVAWFIVLIFFMTGYSIGYFNNKTYYKQHDEEIVYRLKDAWREDS